MSDKLNVEDTLEERGKAYGDYQLLSITAQSLRNAMRAGNWVSLSSWHREALDMVAHKIARIIHSPYYEGSQDPEAEEALKDSVRDIIGYMEIGFKDLFKK